MQQMLTRTLKALERDEAVSRTVHPTVPPQVEYALTNLGRSLAEPLRALGRWAGENLDVIEPTAIAMIGASPPARRPPDRSVLSSARSSPIAARRRADRSRATRPRPGCSPG